MLILLAASFLVQTLMATILVPLFNMAHVYCVLQFSEN